MHLSSFGFHCEAHILILHKMYKKTSQSNLKPPSKTLKDFGELAAEKKKALQLDFVDNT